VNYLQAHQKEFKTLAGLCISPLEPDADGTRKLIALASMILQNQEHFFDSSTNPATLCNHQLFPTFSHELKPCVVGNPCSITVPGTPKNSS
jgi:hypothetical protein